MAIKVVCEVCARAYNVKDELEGKKIRCKDCQTVILVQDQSEDDWDDSIDEEELQPPVRKSKSKSRNPRSPSSESGMPVTIIVALSCLAIMICVTILEIFGIGAHLLLVGVPQEKNPGMTVGVIIRCFVQMSVFWGVLKGTASTVTPSIVMGILTIMISVGAAALVGLVAGGGLLAIIFLFFALLRVVYIGCMLTQSAKDHMQN